MSLPVPLVVWLRTDRGSRNITADLRDLSFRSAIPGGFASARLSLSRPLHITPDEVAYFADVTIYDRNTGEIEWAGQLEDPARQVGDGGPLWSLVAIGGAGHAQDRNVPAVWVDRDLSPWLRSGSAPGADTGTGEDPGGSGSRAVVLRFPSSLPITGGTTAQMVYDRLVQSGQRLGLFGYSWDAGITDPNLFIEGVASDGAADTVARSDAADTAGGALNGAWLGTHWTVPRDRVKLRLRWAGGALTVPDDTRWASLAGVVVVAARKTKAGVDLAAMPPNGFVRTHEVVEDLLGWLLPRYDGANALVDTLSTYSIQQLAYPDGVTPAAVLADLMRFEPNYFWAAWERTPAGLYRFEWRPWPTGLRYDAPVAYGLDSPASAGGLFNAVAVRYRDEAGTIRVARYTQPVPALDTAGVVRDAFLDLGDEVGGLSAANRVGPEFLTQHATPPNAGRLTVTGPIYDAVRGRMVPPWKIRPGGLIRVAGVQPRPDSLNPTTRDGATVFRVVGSEFSASRAAAVLDLDSTPLSVAAGLAEQRRTVGRRRR